MVTERFPQQFLDVFTSKRHYVSPSFRHLMKIGIQCLDQALLVHLARHKPGGIGDQAAVALLIQPYGQRHGIFVPCGRLAAGGLVGVGICAGAASPLRAIRSAPKGVTLRVAISHSLSVSPELRVDVSP